MNRSALKQVSGQWEGILSWVGPEVGSPSSLRESLSVALLATVEPSLHHLSHPHAPVPAPISARHKACLGFCQILFFMLINDPEPDEAKLSDYGSKEEFFQWLDTEGWLLGQQQACAGPQRMIEQLFERFCRAQLSPEKKDLVDQLTVLVALQSIHVLSNHRQKGSIAARLFERGQSPWLFTSVQNPRRDPNDITKLFAQKRPPSRVEALLAEPSDESLFLSLSSFSFL